MIQDQVLLHVLFDYYQFLESEGHKKEPLHISVSMLSQFKVLMGVKRTTSPHSRSRNCLGRMDSFSVGFLVLFLIASTQWGSSLGVTSNGERKTYIVKLKENDVITPLKVEINEADQTEYVMTLDPNEADKTVTLYDYKTRFIAYKDVISLRCFLSKMEEDETIDRETDRLEHEENNVIEDVPTVNMTASIVTLSPATVRRLAGPKIEEFCRGFKTSLAFYTTSASSARRSKRSVPDDYVHRAYQQFGQESKQVAHFNHETRIPDTGSQSQAYRSHQQDSPSVPQPSGNGQGGVLKQTGSAFRESGFSGHEASEVRSSGNQRSSHYSSGYQGYFRQGSSSMTTMTGGQGNGFDGLQPPHGMPPGFPPFGGTGTGHSGFGNLPGAGSFFPTDDKGSMGVFPSPATGSQSFRSWSSSGTQSGPSSNPRTSETATMLESFGPLDPSTFPLLPPPVFTPTDHHLGEPKLSVPVHSAFSSSSTGSSSGSASESRSHSSASSELRQAGESPLSRQTYGGPSSGPTSTHAQGSQHYRGTSSAATHSTGSSYGSRDSLPPSHTRRNPPTDSRTDYSTSQRQKSTSSDRHVDLENILQQSRSGSSPHRQVPHGYQQPPALDSSSHSSTFSQSNIAGSHSSSQNVDVRNTRPVYSSGSHSTPPSSENEQPSLRQPVYRPSSYQPTGHQRYPTSSDLRRESPRTDGGVHSPSSYPGYRGPSDSSTPRPYDRREPPVRPEQSRSTSYSSYDAARQNRTTDQSSHRMTGSGYAPYSQTRPVPTSRNESPRNESLPDTRGTQTHSPDLTYPYGQHGYTRPDRTEVPTQSGRAEFGRPYIYQPANRTSQRPSSPSSRTAIFSGSPEEHHEPFESSPTRRPDDSAQGVDSPSDTEVFYKSKSRRVQASQDASEDSAYLEIRRRQPRPSSPGRDSPYGAQPGSLESSTPRTTFDRRGPHEISQYPRMPVTDDLPTTERPSDYLSRVEQRRVPTGGSRDEPDSSPFDRNYLPYSSYPRPQIPTEEKSDSSTSHGSYATGTGRRDHYSSGSSPSNEVPHSPDRGTSPTFPPFPQVQEPYKHGGPENPAERRPDYHSSSSRDSYSTPNPHLPSRIPDDRSPTTQGNQDDNLSDRGDIPLALLEEPSNYPLRPSVYTQPASPHGTDDRPGESSPHLSGAPRVPSGRPDDVPSRPSYYRPSYQTRPTTSPRDTSSDSVDTLYAERRSHTQTQPASPHGTDDRPGESSPHRSGAPQVPSGRPDDVPSRPSYYRPSYQTRPTTSPRDTSSDSVDTLYAERRSHTQTQPASPHGTDDRPGESSPHRSGAPQVPSGRPDDVPSRPSYYRPLYQTRPTTSPRDTSPDNVDTLYAERRSHSQISASSATRTDEFQAERRRPDTRQHYPDTSPQGSSFNPAPMAPIHHGSDSRDGQRTAPTDEVNMPPRSPDTFQPVEVGGGTDYFEDIYPGSDVRIDVSSGTATAHGVQETSVQEIHRSSSSHDVAVPPQGTKVIPKCCPSYTRYIGNPDHPIPESVLPTCCHLTQNAQAFQRCCSAKYFMSFQSHTGVISATPCPTTGDGSIANLQPHDMTHNLPGMSGFSHTSTGPCQVVRRTCRVVYKSGGKTRICRRYIQSTC